MSDWFREANKDGSLDRFLAMSPEQRQAMQGAAAAANPEVRALGGSGTVNQPLLTTWQHKGPQNQPPMSLEEAQRLWAAQDADPNIMRPFGGGGQNFQQTFQQIMGGLPATPENLIAKEQELRAAGIEVRRNAKGTAGKIGILGQPDQIYDVIANAEGGGGGNWQWNYAPPGSHGGAQQGSWNFQGPGFPAGGMSGGGASLASLGGGGSLASREAAHAGSPGYDFIMKEAIGALDKSAAAKGTLLSGGHIKDLADRAAGLASMDFNNEFNRNMSLAGLGFNAASSQGAYGSAYGNQLTDLTTGAGNARAAGTAASGNAWGNALGNLGNLGIQAGMYQWMKPPTYSGLDYE